MAQIVHNGKDSKEGSTRSSSRSPPCDRQGDRADGQTGGGIILPDTSNDEPHEGKVIQVGPGRVLDSGTRAAPEVKAGDRVNYSKSSGATVKVGDVGYLVVRKSDLHAIRT